MRSLTVVACAALSGALVVWLGLPLAAAAEDLPQYTVPRANAAETIAPADSEDGLDLDLVFPLSQLPQLGRATSEVEIDLRPSSRRGDAWRRWLPQAQAEPGMLSPDADRPPKPLTGEWAEKAIWQSDYVDTWGTHPATPVPSARRGTVCGSAISRWCPWPAKSLWTPRRSALPATSAASVTSAKPASAQAALASSAKVPVRRSSSTERRPRSSWS